MSDIYIAHRRRSSKQSETGPGKAAKVFLPMLRKGCLVFAPAVFLIAQAEAQDAVRPSVAGSEVAAERLNTISQTPYNLRMGGLDFRFGADLRTEYNDNISIAEYNRLSDVIVEPHFDIEGILRVTSLNVLRFNLGLGYDEYLIHSQYSSKEPIIAPGSEVSFDLFLAGNLRITFHDRFDIEQSPLDEPALSNIVEFRRIENTAGFTGVWDANRLIVTAGYDHFNYMSLSSDFRDLDRQADSVLTSATWSFNDTTRAGIDANATYTDYVTSFHNDSTTITVGPFFKIGLSPYMKIALAAGYQGMQFDHDGSIHDESNLNDWYGNLVFVHRFNRFLTQTFTAGHESQLGLNSNYETIDYARYGAALKFLNAFTTEVDLMWENLAESGGLLPERLQRYSLDVKLTYQLTKRVQMTLGYSFLDKQSDIPGFAYEQDRIHLDLAYQF